MRLSPYPEYKDSGVAWVPKIPVHWSIRRNGTLFAQRNETNSPDLPILEVSLKTGVTVRNLDNLARKQMMSDHSLYKRAARGDLAYNMMRMWQGAVGVVPQDGLVSPAYVVVRPYSHAVSKFYEYQFRMAAYKAEVDGYSRGIVKDRNRLYWEDFKRIPSLFPKYEEQTQIARFLDWKTAQIDRFIRNKRRLIELLKEQKQALINQAVTGRIDVRTGKPYLEYKDSGMPWLGKVPVGWDIRKFKYLARFTSGGTPSKSVDGYWHGTLPWVSPKDMKSREVHDAEDHISEQAVKDSATSLAKPGELLIVVRSGILRRTIPVGIVKREVAFNQDIKAIAPKQDAISSDYLLFLINGCDHLLRDEWVKVGATVESIEHELMANTYFPVPTLEEQSIITNFCKKIEDSVCKAVTRTQREIDLMQECRTCLISDVVTGKLDVRGVEIPAWLDEGEDGAAPENPHAIPTEKMEIA